MTDSCPYKFYKACKNGDINKALLMIDDVNTYDYASGLSIAIVRKHFHIVKKFEHITDAYQITYRCSYHSVYARLHMSFTLVSEPGHHIYHCTSHVAWDTDCVLPIYRYYINKEKRYKLEYLIKSVCDQDPLYYLMKNRDKSILSELPNGILRQLRALC